MSEKLFNKLPKISLNFEFSKTNTLKNLLGKEALYAGLIASGSILTNQTKDGEFINPTKFFEKNDGIDTIYPIKEFFHDPVTAILSPVSFAIKHKKSESNITSSVVSQPYNSTASGNAKQFSENVKKSVENTTNQVQSFGTPMNNETIRKILEKKYSNPSQSSKINSIESVNISASSSPEYTQNGNDSITQPDAQNLVLANQRLEVCVSEVKKALGENVQINTKVKEANLTQKQLVQFDQEAVTKGYTGFTANERITKLLVSKDSKGEMYGQNNPTLAELRNCKFEYHHKVEQMNTETVSISSFLPLLIVGVLSIKMIFKKEKSTSKPKSQKIFPETIKTVEVKPKLELFKPEVVDYDEFMPNHMRIADIRDGLDIAKIVDSFIKPATTLQNKIRSGKHDLENIKFEYINLVNRVEDLLYRKMNKYDETKNNHLSKSEYNSGITSEFRGFHYITNHNDFCTRKEYAKIQSKMLVQMMMRGSDKYRISMACFVGARIKAAIRQNQMNRF